MPREYKVFHGVGGVVVHVNSHTDLEVLAITTQGKLNVEVPESRRIKVDLTATPSRLGQTAWSAVKFDDRGVDENGASLPLTDIAELDLGITTLGSGTLDDQVLGAFVGGVFIEQSHYKEIYKECIGYLGADWPRNYCDPVEITTIAYSNHADNGAFAGKRYHGFLATLVSSSATDLRVRFKRAPALGTVVFQRSGTDFDTAPAKEAHDGVASLAAMPPPAEGVLFVRLERAAKLVITDPKLPIGLEGFRMLGRAALAATPETKRINISLQNPDPALAEVLGNIRDVVRVTGAFPEKNDRTGVVGAVAGMQGPKDSVEVDLIAHASHGVLQFGRWVIDRDERASVDLLRAWENRSPSMIRLLGCNTARTKAGRAAMQHLKSVLNVPVYGATRPLYARYFGRAGLLPELAQLLLIECEKLHTLTPMSTPVPDAVVDEWFADFQPVPDASVIDVRKLRAETLEEARFEWLNAGVPNPWPFDEPVSDKGIDLDAFLHNLRPGFARAPGLLALPDSEQLYPAESPDGVPLFHRVTSILDGAFVRIYPEGYNGGVLIRTRGGS